MKAKARSLISVNAIAFVIGAALLFLMFGAGSGGLVAPAIASAALFVVLFWDAIAWRRSGIRRIELREGGINAWRGSPGEFDTLAFWEISGLFKVSSGARASAHILTGGRVRHFCGAHWVAGPRWSVCSDAFDDVEFAIFVELLERSIESWRIPRVVSLLMAGELDGTSLDEAGREEAGALLARILACPYDETREDERRHLEAYAEGLREPPAPVLSIEEIEAIAPSPAPPNGAATPSAESAWRSASKPFWPVALTIDPPLKIKALLALRGLFPSEPGRIPAGLCDDEDDEVAAMARGFRSSRALGRR